MESFKNDFGLPHGSDGFSNEKNASVSSNVVSLLTAGSFFGAIAAAFINEKWGRLYTLMGFCGIFNVGAALQTAAHHDIALIYAGRVIAGVGIGGCSAVMSVFVSEAAPPRSVVALRVCSRRCWLLVARLLTGLVSYAVQSPKASLGF